MVGWCHSVVKRTLTHTHIQARSILNLPAFTSITSKRASQMRIIIYSFYIPLALQIENNVSISILKQISSTITFCRAWTDVVVNAFHFDRRVFKYKVQSLQKHMLYPAYHKYLRTKPPHRHPTHKHAHIELDGLTSLIEYNETLPDTLTRQKDQNTDFVSGHTHNTPTQTSHALCRALRKPLASGMEVSFGAQQLSVRFCSFRFRLPDPPTSTRLPFRM